MKSEMRSAVLLLRSAQTADQLTAELSAAGIEVTSVLNAEGLWQFLESQLVDLVVLEQEISGFLSGVEIIRKLSATHASLRYVLLRREESEVSEDDLTNCQVISSQSEVAEICRACRRLLTDTPTLEWIPKPARLMVANCSQLAPIPQLLVKLLDFMSIPVQEIPVKEMARDISADSRSTAELLRFTNSSYVGLSKPLSSVFDALNLVGPRRTIAILFSAAAVDVQKQMLRGWSDPLREWFHERSVLMAAVASTFADELERVSSDTAFVLGLIQNMDMSILMDAKPKTYAMILNRFIECGAIDLGQLEIQEFRATHSQVTVALLERWKLPRSLGEIVLRFDDAEQPKVDSREDRGFVRVLGVAEAVANLSANAHPARVRQLNARLRHYRDEQFCRECLSQAVLRAAEFASMVRTPIRDPESLIKVLSAMKNKLPKADCAAQTL